MKKSKKGFTLIELLAVIAILAILVVIAVPAVLDLFNQSKVSAFKTQAQSMFKGAETQIIQEQLKPNGSSTKTYCHDDNNSTTDELLSLQGTSAVYYKIVFTAGKMTSFVVSDNNYNYSITSAEVTINDIGEPATGSATVNCGS